MPKPRLRAGKDDNGAPSSKISPPLRSDNPAMSRSKVVLPHPDGPKRQTNSPCSISMETLSNAVNVPKVLVAFRTDKYMMDTFSVQVARTPMGPRAQYFGLLGVYLAAQLFFPHCFYRSLVLSRFDKVDIRQNGRNV